MNLHKVRALPNICASTSYKSLVIDFRCTNRTVLTILQVYIKYNDRLSCNLRNLFPKVCYRKKNLLTSITGNL